MMSSRPSSEAAACLKLLLPHAWLHLDIIFCFFLLNNNNSSKSNNNNKEEDTPLLTPNLFLFYARSVHQHLNYDKTQQQNIKQNSPEAT